MLVHVHLPKSKEPIMTLATMPKGSIGKRLSDGRHYIRTCDSAYCLEDVGGTYIGNADLRNNPETDRVDVYPPGTVLELTIE